jgi:hypothetical protein
VVAALSAAVALLSAGISSPDAFLAGVAGAIAALALFAHARSLSTMTNARACPQISGAQSAAFAPTLHRDRLGVGSVSWLTTMAGLAGDLKGPYAVIRWRAS